MAITPSLAARYGSIGGDLLIAKHGANEVAARARGGIGAAWLAKARAELGNVSPERLEEAAAMLYRADMKRRSMKGVAARKARAKR